MFHFSFGLDLTQKERILRVAPHGFCSCGLVWSSDDGREEKSGGFGFFWLPQPPEDYNPMGFLVATDKPDLDEVWCSC